MPEQELPLHLFCSRCGRRLERGRTYYIVTVTLTAEMEGGIAQSVSQADVEDIWAQIEQKSGQELEEEVFQRIQFILCKPCRDAFVQSPLGKEAAFSPMGQT